jgi:hypothetical protein
LARRSKTTRTTPQRDLGDGARSPRPKFGEEVVPIVRGLVVRSNPVRVVALRLFRNKARYELRVLAAGAYMNSRTLRELVREDAFDGGDLEARSGGFNSYEWEALAVRR